MKGITPIIATIVLLLITVALAGAAWNYLWQYWNSIVGKQIEMTDAFCVGGDQAVVFIRNSGTNPFSPATEITVADATTGTAYTAAQVTWSYADGTPIGASGLAPGKISKLQVACLTGSLCKIRVMSSSGRAHTASVQC